MSPRRARSFAGGLPVSGGLVAFAACGLILFGLWAVASHAQWPTWLSKPPKPVTYPEILVSPSWVNARLGKPGVLILDARHPEAFAAGHVPGAVSVGLEEHGVAGLAPGRWKSARTIIGYGSRSREPLAAGDLFLAQVQLHPPPVSIHVLNGGFEAWEAAGLRQESGASGGYRPFPDPRSPSSDSLVATLDWIAARLGEPGITLLDARPQAEWEAGHIPHSLPFDFNECLNDDGTMMDGPTMRPILASIGPRPREFIDLEDEIVVVGHPAAGARAHPFLALRVAGVERVRMAEVTMKEWRSAGRPVTRIVHAAEAVRLVGDAHRGRVRDKPVPGLILFDLRHEPDFASSHLPGAILLPPDRFATQLDSVVAARWPGVDKATIPFAVYCYGPDCIRSRNATTTAARHGFRNLLWLRDGPQAFRSAGGVLYPK
jgi:3-mercaptopyruvate sulfurtransferase SseA